jgi:thiol:disulfide interchange protein
MMQTAQPTASPLGILLLIAAIYLLVTSPKKLQTLGRMAIAFVVTALAIMVTGAILRRGDPQALGAIAGLVAMLLAVIAGWWHTRSLKRGSRETSERPDSKP